MSTVTPVVTNLDSALTIIGALAGTFVPGAQVLGFTVPELVAVAHGLEQGIPDAVSLFDEIKSLAAGGGTPTAEQRAQWRARALTVHEAIQATP